MSFKDDIHVLKKIIIKSLLIQEECALLSISKCQLFTAKAKSNSFHYSDIEGALTLIYDTKLKCFKFIIYDQHNFDILLEIKLSEKFQSFYTKAKSTFHSFSISEGYFGFLFPSSSHAEEFYSIIKNLKNQTKEQIESNYINSIKQHENKENFNNLKAKLISNCHLEHNNNKLKDKNISFNIVQLCNYINSISYNENSNRFEYYGSKQLALDFIKKYNINIKELDIKNLGNVMIRDRKSFTYILANHIVNDVGLKHFGQIDKREKIISKMKTYELKLILEEDEESYSQLETAAPSLRQTVKKTSKNSTKMPMTSEDKKDEKESSHTRHKGQKLFDEINKPEERYQTPRLTIHEDWVKIDTINGFDCKDKMKGKTEKKEDLMIGKKVKEAKQLEFEEVNKEEEENKLEEKVIESQEEENKVEEENKAQEEETKVKEENKAQEEENKVEEENKAQEEETKVKEENKAQEEETKVKEENKAQEEENKVESKPNEEIPKEKPILQKVIEENQEDPQKEYTIDSDNNTKQQEETQKILNRIKVYSKNGPNTKMNVGKRNTVDISNLPTVRNSLTPKVTVEQSEDKRHESPKKLSFFEKLGVKHTGKFDFSQFDNKPKQRKEDNTNLQNVIRNLKKISPNTQSDN